MTEKLKKMKLNDRIRHGYAMVIKNMIVTGFVAIICLGI